MRTSPRGRPCIAPQLVPLFALAARHAPRVSPAKGQFRAPPCPASGAPPRSTDAPPPAGRCESLMKLAEDSPSTRHPSRRFHSPNAHTSAMNTKVAARVTMPSSRPRGPLVECPSDHYDREHEFARDASRRATAFDAGRASAIARMRRGLALSVRAARHVAPSSSHSSNCDVLMLFPHVSCSHRRTKCRARACQSHRDISSCYPQHLSDLGIVQSFESQALRRHGATSGSCCTCRSRSSRCASRSAASSARSEGSATSSQPRQVTPSYADFDSDA